MCRLHPRTTPRISVAATQTAERCSLSTTHSTRVAEKYAAACLTTACVELLGVSWHTIQASEHLPFWDTDEKNPRSQVTLQTLLSFTSGLLTDEETSCQLAFEHVASYFYCDVANPPSDC
jgi:hypothetical protein